MREILFIVMTLSVHMAFRVAMMLYVGLRLIIVMATFLALACALSWTHGISQEVHDLAAISLGFAGLAFVFWLAATP